MTLNEIAQEMDELATKAWALDGFITIVSDALFLAQREPKEFEGAMYAMQDTSWVLVEKARTITDEIFSLLHADEVSGK